MQSANHLIKFGTSERSQSFVQFGLQRVRESIGSVWGFKARFASHLFQNGLFKARFASHLIQNGASKRVSRVIWFRTGIQSAFRESFDSIRGLQSAFRESFDSKRGFKARFASHLIQNGALQSAFRESFDSKRGFGLNQMTRERALKPRFGFLTVTNLPGTPENS